MRGTVVKRLRKEATKLRNQIASRGGFLDQIPSIKWLLKALKKKYLARAR